MTRLTRITTVAVFAAAAWAGASSFTPAAAAPLQEGLTQELSAACRTVTSTRWHHGRRVTTRKRVCTPSYGYVRPAYRSYGYSASCRYVTKYRWSNGRRVTVRTRVC